MNNQSAVNSVVRIYRLTVVPSKRNLLEITWVPLSLPQHTGRKKFP